MRVCAETGGMRSRAGKSRSPAGANPRRAVQRVRSHLLAGHYPNKVGARRTYGLSGKAAGRKGLRTRLRQSIDFGCGQPVGHREVTVRVSLSARPHLQAASREAPGLSELCSAVTLPAPHPVALSSDSLSLNASHSCGLIRAFVMLATVIYDDGDPTRARCSGQPNVLHHN